MLTVACVWVQANVPYDVDYVFKLHSMVSRNLKRPFTFACITDKPLAKLPDRTEAWPVPRPRGMAGWWSKIELFNPARFGQGRILYLDLDVVVVGPLDDIVDYPATFALVPDAGTFQGRDGLKVVKKYNSSVMAWDAGTLSDIYTKWRPEVTRRLWGDQDWIGLARPNEQTMPLAWFPRLSQGRWDTQAKVVLAKKPKPHVAAQQWPWFKEWWR